METKAKTQETMVIMVERGPSIACANWGLPCPVDGVIPNEPSLLVANTWNNPP
jgi:hypothetical protein